MFCWSWRTLYHQGPFSVVVQAHLSDPGLEGPILTVAKGRPPMPPSPPPLPGQSLILAKPLVVKTITLLPAKADCQLEI